MVVVVVVVVVVVAVVVVVVVLWCCGVVVLWCCGVVVLWCCGVVVLWCCGVVVLWCVVCCGDRGSGAVPSLPSWLTTALEEPMQIQDNRIPPTTNPRKVTPGINKKCPTLHRRQALDEAHCLCTLECPPALAMN